MKKFIRDNPTIAFGLGLPLLLLVVFLAISGIPALLVPPAQYDVLYVTNYNYYNNAQNTFQIAVVGDRVRVHYIGNTLPYQQPHLWRFNPQTGAVKEVAIPLPSDLAPHRSRPAEAEKTLTVTPISVPDLVALKVDASSLAPDGYKFSSGDDSYAGRPFTGLFYPSRYGYQAELVKDGRSIRLPNTDDIYRGHSVHFIGWVIP